MYFFSSAGLIACKDVGIFEAFSCPWPPSPTFYKLLEIERTGYVGFFQFLRNFRERNACEQTELILQAALDPAISSRAKKGEFVTCFDHFDLLQTAIN